MQLFLTYSVSRLVCSDNKFIDFVIIHESKRRCKLMQSSLVALSTILFNG